jgi:predicted MFS family arabinose efflux permease
MAYVNGWRSMVASTVGMGTAPEDKVAVMAMRAAANQFGYLLGAAAGGLALAVAGFSGLGVALAGLFLIAVATQMPALGAVHAGITRRPAARSA